MTGYILLAVFIFFVFSVLAAFLFGLSKGKKSERQIWQERETQRANEAARYGAEKEKILAEVFSDAEKQKSELSGGATGRERFDAIGNVLRK